MPKKDKRNPDKIIFDPGENLPALCTLNSSFHLKYPCRSVRSSTFKYESTLYFGLKSYKNFTK